MFIMPLWRVLERLIDHPMLDNLAELRIQQWLPFEEIEAIRHQKLKKLLSGMGRDGAKLRDIPVSEKTDIGQQFQRYKQNSNRFDFIASSSGSTGTNTRVWCDNNTSARTRANFVLALEWSNWTIGEAHLQTGMNVKRGLLRFIKDTMLKTYYVSISDLSPRKAQDILTTMQEKGIRHLWGYPGALYFIAQQAELSGWNAGLNSVVTWGDNLYAHYRQQMESAFKTKVYDTYGIGEGVQIAAQCGFEDNYHIHALDVILEAVDDSDFPVASGQRGQALVTRLLPGPQPIVRYRVGDLVTLKEGNCPCGRELPLLQNIDGRDTDIIRTPSGQVLIVHFFTGLFEHYDFVESFQVRQTKLDCIQLLLVLKDEKKPANQKHRILTDLRSLGLIDIDIEIEVVDQIPLTQSGKRRFVISDLPDLNKKRSKSVPASNH